MLSPKIRERIYYFMHEVVPFNKFLGFKLAELSDGRAVIELPFREEHVGDPVRPALHGGVISALLDTCAGAAIFTKLSFSETCSTVDLRVDYIRPAPLETIVAEAIVVRVGNRVGVTDMRVYSKREPERTIATGKAVFNIKREHPAIDTQT